MDVRLQLTIVVLASGMECAIGRGSRSTYGTAASLHPVLLPSRSGECGRPGSLQQQRQIPVAPANGVVLNEPPESPASTPSSPPIPSLGPLKRNPLRNRQLQRYGNAAQWKAEQSARMCSVQHLGGGFGGGSFEGNGFGATAQQAIQNCCFWGQRTPIEIGVARGANGYYATVFFTDNIVVWLNDLFRMCNMCMFYTYRIRYRDIGSHASAM